MIPPLAALIHPVPVKEWPPTLFLSSCTRVVHPSKESLLSGGKSFSFSVLSLSFQLVLVLVLPGLFEYSGWVGGFNPFLACVHFAVTGYLPKMVVFLSYLGGGVGFVFGFVSCPCLSLCLHRAVALQVFFPPTTDTSFSLYVYYCAEPTSTG
jgi:hypothetical protein